MNGHKVRPALWTWASESLVLIGTIVFGNTVTWHMQQLWGASGNFWQWQWTRFLDVVGDDEFNLYVYGTTILTCLLYWAVSLVYVFMDVYNWPRCIRKYKVQPGTNEPVDNKRLIKAVGQVIFNQIVVGLPFSLVAFTFMKRFTTIPDIHILPDFWRVLIEFGFLIAIEEVVFYYSHRLLHHRKLYKYVHKQHHEWSAPIAISAIYCHPLEHLLSNVLPPALGITLTGSHLATCWLWFSLIILRTVNDHSGYHLPGFPSPEAHDFHHKKFTECYGVLGILDYLHGTDTHFRSSPTFKRHVVSLKMEPLRQQFPDAIKNLD